MKETLLSLRRFGGAAQSLHRTAGDTKFDIIDGRDLSGESLPRPSRNGLVNIKTRRINDVTGVVSIEERLEPMALRLERLDKGIPLAESLGFDCDRGTGCCWAVRFERHGQSEIPSRSLRPWCSI